MNHLLKPRIIFAIALSHVLSAAAQNERSTPVLDDQDLPVTITALQDVEITALQENVVTADGAARYSLATLGLRKDQQFQMTAIHLEGGCEILFEGEHYSLASCPWLPGFRDHREDIFRVDDNP